MAANRRAASPAAKDEKVLVAAGGFTGLWAITWLGAEALAVSAALQGGFAVGGAVAGSGLAALWWKTQALRDLNDEAERTQADAEREAREA